MNNDDLVQALLEEGIDPSATEIARLDDQITELVEILLDYLHPNDSQASRNEYLSSPDPKEKGIPPEFQRT
jgi:hypothetical protein